MAGTSSKMDQDGEYFASYAPHPSTITETGAQVYHNVHGMESFAFAMAELVDNSLAATKSNHLSGNPRNISISVHLDYDNGGDSGNYIIVRDNGRGMKNKDIETWATYRKGREERKDQLKHTDIEANEGDFHFLNSEISYFGVGGKQAAFYMGRKVHVISKAREEGSRVCEMLLDAEEMHRRYENGERVYEDNIPSRSISAGELRCYRDEDYGPYFDQEFGYSEDKDDGFSAIIIKQLKKDLVGRVLTDKKEIGSWIETLSHIYHYYLHDENRILSESKSSLKLSVAVYHGGDNIITTSDLKEFSNIQLKFEQAMARFTGTSDTKGTAKDRLEFQCETDMMRNGAILKAKINGFLRYHPIQHGVDSIPTTKDGVLNKFYFNCFWNGRLISNTRIGQLSFFKPTSRVKVDDISSLDRMSGCLFFTYPWEVTQNKMSLKNDGSGIDELLRKIEVSNFRERFSGRGRHTREGTFDRTFVNWINALHQKYDTQIMFSSPQKELVYIPNWIGTSNDQVESLRAPPKVCANRSKKRCTGTCSCYVVYTAFNIIEFREVMYKNKKAVNSNKKSMLLQKPNFVILQKLRPKQYARVDGYLMEGDFTKTKDKQAVPSSRGIRYLYKRLEPDLDNIPMQSRVLQELIDSHIRKKDDVVFENESAIKQHLLLQEPASISVERVIMKNKIGRDIEHGSTVEAEDEEMHENGADLCPAEYGPYIVNLKTKEGKELSNLQKKKIKVMMVKELLDENGNVSSRKCKDSFRHHTEFKKYDETADVPSVSGYYFKAFGCRVAGRFRLRFFAFKPKHQSSDKTQIEKEWDGCSDTKEFTVIAGSPNSVDIVESEFKGLVPKLSCDQPLQIDMCVKDAQGNLCLQDNKIWKMKIETTSDVVKFKNLTLTSGRSSNFVATINLSKSDFPKDMNLGELERTNSLFAEMKIIIKLRYQGHQRVKKFECEQLVRIVPGGPENLTFARADAPNEITAEPGDPLYLEPIHVLDKIGLPCAIPDGGCWNFEMQFLRNGKTSSKVPYQCLDNLKVFPPSVNLPLKNIKFPKEYTINVYLISDDLRKDLYLQFTLKMVPSTKPDKIILIHGQTAYPLGENAPTIDCKTGSEVSDLLAVFENTSKENIKKHISEFKFDNRIVSLENLVNLEQKGWAVPLPNVPEERIPLVVDSKETINIAMNIIDQPTKNYSIVLKTVPGEPTKLRIDNPHKIQAGSTIGRLEVTLVDKDGNVVDFFPARERRPKLSADHLEGFDSVNVSDSVMKAVYHKLVFHGPSGPRKVTVTWRGFATELYCPVLPGLPAKIKLISKEDLTMEVKEDLKIVNSESGGYFPSPLLLRIEDNYGNACSAEDIRDCDLGISLSPQGSGSKGNVLLSSSVDKREPTKNLRLEIQSQPQPIVNFGDVVLQLPKSSKIELPRTFLLQGRLTNIKKKSTDLGSDILVNVAPDPMTVTGIKVFTDGDRLAEVKTLEVKAGQKPAKLLVSLRAHGGFDITENPGTPAICKILSNHNYGENIGAWIDGTYQFNDLNLPTTAGIYKLEFSINKSKKKIKQEIELTVNHSDPKSISAFDTKTGHVIKEASLHNTGKSKYFCENSVKIQLVDKYDNQVRSAFREADNQCLSFKIVGPSGITVPALHSSNLSGLTLTDGNVYIDHLKLEDKTIANDGEYELIISLPGVDSHKIKFHFSNDLAKQQALEEKKKLSQLRDRQEAAKVEKIKGIKLGMEDAQNLLSRIDKEIKENSTHLNSLAHMCHIQDWPVNVSSSKIEDQITEVKQKEVQYKKLKRSQKDGREVIRLNPPLSDDPEVVGFLGSLIACEDDQVCKILGWHLRRGKQLEVLICDTLEAANRHKDNYEVLPLETAKQSDDNWFRKVVVPEKMNFFKGEYFGNVVTFPENDVVRSKAVKAFNALIGRLAFFPTVQDANLYRRAMHGRVGMLWGLDGLKVAASGVFGGKSQQPNMQEMRYHFPKEQVLDFSTNFHSLISKLKKRKELYIQSEDYTGKIRDLEVQLEQESTGLDSANIERKINGKEGPTSIQQIERNKDGHPSPHYKNRKRKPDHSPHSTKRRRQNR